MKKLFVLALFLLFLVSGAYAKPNKMEGSEYIISAIEAYKNKNYEVAIEKLELAKNLYPNNPNILSLIATCNIDLHKTQEAKTILKEGMEKYPKDWHFYALSGIVAKNEGEGESAIEYYKKAIKCPKIQKIRKKEYKETIKNINEIMNKQQELKNLGDLFEKKPDENMWVILDSVTKNGSFLVEYHLKKEIFLYPEWTKLISINYFKDPTYKYDLKKQYEEYISSLNHIAKNLNTSVKLTKISSSNNEIIFMWSMKEREESEITRIFKSENSFTYVHYGIKKANLTTDEQKEGVKIVKSIKLKNNL